MQFSTVEKMSRSEEARKREDVRVRVRSYERERKTKGERRKNWF